MSHIINGRTSVHKDSGGKLITMDVCLTPVGNSVVAMPYTNVAESKDADNTAETVTVQGNPACTVDSTFSKSRGDEPGRHGGVVSGTTRGYACFIMGSPNVKMEKRAAARALDQMVSNAKNTPPASLMQEISLPPCPLRITGPDTLAECQGPNHNAVACLMPDGLKTFTGLAATRLENGCLVRFSTDINSNGRVEIDHLLGDSSRFSWVVQETTPWPYKTDKYILLPLADMDNPPMDEPIDEPETELTCLRLQRYLTSEKDPEQVDMLRDGWLYVFVNGHLWRELEVKQGTFRDVDLKTWQGMDGNAKRPGQDVAGVDKPNTRQGTGLNQRYIEVPSRLGGEPCEVQVAYSEVQWSWARIVSLGGLNPDDPRLSHIVQEGETLAQIAEAHPMAKGAQTLADLNGLAASATLTPGQVLRLRQADEPPADAAEQRTDRLGDPLDLDALKAEDFTLTLDDPIGWAEYRVAEQLEYRDRIAQITDALKNGLFEDDTVKPTVNGQPIDPANCRADKFKLAQTINYLFNRATLDLEQPGADLDSGTREALSNLKDCADGHLDRSYLRQYLQLDDLEQLARHILAAKIELVKVFDQEGPGSFVAAMRDYGYLPPVDQYQLPKRILGLTRGLKEHPALQFANWLPDNRLLDELADLDPGEDLILQLVGSHPQSKRHPLADCLTPQDTGPGIDDSACRGFPLFHIDGLQQNDALTHTPGFNPDINFGNSKNAVSFLFGLYKQWVVLPEPGLSASPSGEERISQQEQARQTARIQQLERDKRAIEQSLAEQAGQVRSFNTMEREAEHSYVSLLTTDPALEQAATRGARLTFETLKSQRQQAERQLDDLKAEKGRVTTDLTLARQQRQLQTTHPEGHTIKQRPARLAAQVDPLRPLVKGIQSITRMFVEAEVAVHDYWQGIYPGQALPLNLPMRQNAAQSEYNYLTNLMKGEGALVNTYLSGGIATALPVGSGLKRTPLSQYVQDLAREAALKGDAALSAKTPANDEAPKVTVLALKRDASVRSALPTEAITFTPVPKDTDAQRAYLEERVGRLRQDHKVPGHTLATITEAGQQPLRQRAAAAELLVNRFRENRQLSDVDVKTIEKNTQEGPSLIVDSSGQRKTVYRGYQALFTAVAVMEIWNIQKVVEAGNHGSFQEFAGFANSASAIGALVAHLAQTHIEFLYGKITQDELDAVKRRAPVPGASSITPDELKVARKKFFTTAGSHGFGGASNLVGLGVAGLDMYKAWQRNDPWAVTGQGLVALGSALGAGADIWSFFNFVIRGTVSIKYARALGWWSLGLTGLGYALFWFLQDTPMEAWLKHTPFGKDRHSVKDEAYLHWQHWPALAREHLAMLQQTPKLEWYHFNGVPQTNTDFWQQEVSLRIRRPAWSEGKSAQTFTLWWRPIGRTTEQEWRPLSLELNASLSGPAAIDWKYSRQDPSLDGTDYRLNLQWQSLYRLLKEASEFELKAELTYYPQGQNEVFSAALNQPMTLPVPERREPPFSTPVHEPVASAITIVRNNRPIERIPLPDKDKRPVHLLTGQSTG